MSTTTGNYGLKKPQDADNADLKIFVGDNMDIIDAELLKRLTKDITTGKVKTTDLPILDANGSYTNTTNSAFSATSGVSQAITAGGVVKLIFGTEQFDKLGEYDPTTAKFTALSSGIYLFSACVRFPAPTTTVGSGTQIFLAFYKNGVADARVQQLMNGATTWSTGATPTASVAYAPAQAHGNVIMQLNAGDYIEVYTYSSLATSTQGREALAFDTTFFRGIKLA